MGADFMMLASVSRARALASTQRLADGVRDRGLRLTQAAEEWRRHVTAGQALRDQLFVASEVVVGLDREGRITLLSRNGELLLGRLESEVIGRDWIDLVVFADEAPAARVRLERLLSASGLDGESVDFEHAIATAHGRRAFRWRAALDSTAATHCVAVGVDITEQRAAQQQLVRERHDLQQLVGIAQAVARNGDARPAVVDGICELVGATTGGLCELDPSGQALVLTYSTSAEFIGTRFELEGEPSGAAAAFVSGAPIFVAEAEGHPTIQQQLVQATGLRSLLYQPVFVAGEAVGVLSIGWREPVAELGGRQTNLVALAAGEAASAIERLSAMRHWQDAALTDPLTGLPNRRAFHQQLVRELAAAGPGDTVVAVAAMDLNGFKALNDSQGHEAGDRALKEVAGGWSAELRPEDLLARIGGDEFMAILPGCVSSHCDAVAQRLRRAVRHPAGAGVGIAVWDGLESPAELLRRADQALYADKAQGTQRLADPARVRAAHATGLTGAPHDPQLQLLTLTVADMLEVPIATLSILTDTHQYLVGQTGLGDELEHLRHVDPCDSYCRFPASTGRELVVEDTTKSPLLSGEPMTAAMGLRAYAGVPIKLAGHTVGVLGVVTTEPREWTDEQLATLRLAAKNAGRHLATRLAQPASGPPQD